MLALDGVRGCVLVEAAGHLLNPESMSVTEELENGHKDVSAVVASRVEGVGRRSLAGNEGPGAARVVAECFGSWCLEGVFGGGEVRTLVMARGLTAGAFGATLDEPKETECAYDFRNGVFHVYRAREGAMPSRADPARSVDAEMAVAGSRALSVLAIWESLRGMSVSESVGLGKLVKF